MVSIIAEVFFCKLLPNSRFDPHFADLRNAEFWVEAEVQFSGRYGEVVLGPVPQRLKMLIIQRNEGIHAEEQQ